MQIDINAVQASAALLSKMNAPAVSVQNTAGSGTTEDLRIVADLSGRTIVVTRSIGPWVAVVFVDRSSANSAPVWHELPVEVSPTKAGHLVYLLSGGTLQEGLGYSQIIGGAWPKRANQKAVKALLPSDLSDEDVNLLLSAEIPAHLRYSTKDID